MMDNRNRCAAGTRSCGCSACGTAEYSRSRSEAECCAVPELLPVMVFIPVQSWDAVYDCDRALAQGTLFPALDKPFFGKGGCCCDR